VTFPLLPPEGEMSIEQARVIGRRLAEHPLLAARADEERPGVAEVLADARPLLGTHGVGFEVVRSRPGCVVVRSHATGPMSARVACELVKALLSEVTEQVCDIRAALVENVCAQRGAAACVYSIVWEGAPTSAPPSILRSPPGSETLIDPEPALGSWQPAEPEPLPDWNRPIRFENEGQVPPPAPDRQPAATSYPDASPKGTNGHGVLEGSTLGTAATSTTHHFQVSTPNTIVVPAPAPPLQPPPMPSVAFPDPATPLVTTPARRVPRGLIRRGWLVALALVAGSAGGWYAGKHAATSYGAQATVVVRSGSSSSGPGGANDALALATTYAALIPKDQAVLRVVGRALGVAPSTVAKALNASIENGTSILVIDYTGSNAATAINGASAAAEAVASTSPVSLAIGPGSVAVVSLPSSAHLQGTLHKYGIVIGGFLGAAVGLVLVFAAERADPRVDDASALAVACGCRAAAVPAGVSYPELGVVLAAAAREAGNLTVVPIDISDTATSMEMAHELRPWWPNDGPAVRISPAFSSGVVELARGRGPTVLVSHLGSRQRDVMAAAKRLRMIDRAPTWALLVSQRRRVARPQSRLGVARRVG
jgi:capsular polysaccharide biosynthesis protein